MIKKVLIGFALAVVVILLILWLVTGGPRKVTESARGITDSLRLIFGSATSSGGFALPWQPADLSLGPNLDDLRDAEDAMGAGPPEEELAQSQKEYDNLLKQIEAAKAFGEPSPHRGTVHLAEGGATEGLTGEYIELEAAFDNTAPVGVAGWSLQSALTGIRASIPRGTGIFILGDLNVQRDIFLNPGARAIVSSRTSPVGTSFRENLCTGYLSGLQNFTPALSGGCPTGQEALPLTPENLKTYGDACFDFVETIPPCTFPVSMPQNLAPACRLFLANNLSYNGCVQNYRYKVGFSRDSWRIFLNVQGELWRNSHDVIRLLDAQGRTVDAISY